VQPVYVRGTGENTYPLLQRVLVAYGDEIGFAESLDEALNQVFGESAGAVPPPTTAPPPQTGQPGTGDAGEAAAAEARLQRALQDAAAAVRDSDAALKAGDFTRYGEAQRRLNAAVTAAIQAQQAAAAARAPAPSASASPSPSATP
jgi:uncharacterized membrane protein (UPF0182 family)